MLTPEGIEKLISILENYSEVMKSNGVIKKYVFATASLRKIDNSDEALTAVKNRLGIDIDIISGDKEADLVLRQLNQRILLRIMDCLLMWVGEVLKLFIL